jgi:hypothetical protein
MSRVKIDQLGAVIIAVVNQRLSVLLTFFVWFQWNLVPNICTKCCLVLARIAKSCAGRTVCRATVWRFVRKERLRKMRVPFQVLNHLPYCLVCNRSAFRSCRIWDIQTDTNKKITRKRISGITRLYGTSWTVATTPAHQHRCQCSPHPPTHPSPSQIESV